MRRGYTLIELIISIVIIGILSATAFVSLGGYESIRVEAAAKKIAADLDYVRNLSLSTANWHHVAFTTDPNNFYQITQVDAWNEWPVDDPSNPSMDFLVYLNDGYSGVRITNVLLGNDANMTDVYFHPLGIPYQDYDTDGFGVDGQIFLQFGNDGPTRIVQITRNTGRVEIIRP